jgi:hypothetical protein
MTVVSLEAQTNNGEEVKKSGHSLEKIKKETEKADAAPENISGAASRAGQNAIATLSLYPKPLLGDDFDGIPCKIRFSPQYADVWKNALKKMRPTGLEVSKEEENVIGAYVKIFFKKENGKTIYYKSTDRTYNAIREFFSLEKDYEKSIYIGTSFHLTGKLSYSEVKRYIHPDSTYRQRTPYLQSEMAYKKYLEEVKNKNVVETGKMNLLAIVRIDVEDENYLIYVVNHPIVHEGNDFLFFHGGVSKWDGTKWVHRGTGVNFRGYAMESLFFDSLRDLIVADKKSIEFEFSPINNPIVSGSSGKNNNK